MHSMSLPLLGSFPVFTLLNRPLTFPQWAADLIYITSERRPNILRLLIFHTCSKKVVVQLTLLSGVPKLSVSPCPRGAAMGWERSRVSALSHPYSIKYGWSEEGPYVSGYYPPPPPQGARVCRECSRWRRRRFQEQFLNQRTPWTTARCDTVCSLRTCKAHMFL